jgi:hypothetical protein
MTTLDVYVYIPIDGWEMMASEADAPSTDSPPLLGVALEKMAARLADGLAYGCICERWSELDASERYAPLGALLMRWDLLECAASDYRVDGLPPTLQRQFHR